MSAIRLSGRLPRKHLLAALVVMAIGTIGWAALMPIRTESRDRMFEIPKGTWARRMAGSKVEILPAEIRLTLGVRDILVLKNLDDVPQVFGSILMMPGQSFIDAEPRRRRLALVSIGHADGFPRSSNAKTKLYAIIGGYRCPVTAPSSLDLLAIDITDLPDARAGSIGEMATLIASTMTIDEVAEATRSTGREVLTALGSRFHRIYYAT